MSDTVQLCAQPAVIGLEKLCRPYGLKVKSIADNEPIPGSFWQPPEAGLVKNTLYIRSDTPVHSALHEACHFICMDSTRREALNTNAGGGYAEEDAVCFLQVLLSVAIDGYDRATLFRDMDIWGYSFRLGSSKSWFEHDAEDARDWLSRYAFIDHQQRPTGSLRSDL